MEEPEDVHHAIEAHHAEVPTTPVPSPSPRVNAGSIGVTTLEGQHSGAATDAAPVDNGGDDAADDEAGDTPSALEVAPTSPRPLPSPMGSRRRSFPNASEAAAHADAAAHALAVSASRDAAESIAELVRTVEALKKEVSHLREANSDLKLSHDDLRRAHDAQAAVIADLSSAVDHLKAKAGRSVAMPPALPGVSGAATSNTAAGAYASAGISANRTTSSAPSNDSGSDSSSSGPKSWRASLRPIRVPDANPRADATAHSPSSPSRKGPAQGTRVRRLSRDLLAMFDPSAAAAAAAAAKADADAARLSPVASEPGTPTPSPVADRDRRSSGRGGPGRSPLQTMTSSRSVGESGAVATPMSTRHRRRRDRKGLFVDVLGDAAEVGPTSAGGGAPTPASLATPSSLSAAAASGNMIEEMRLTVDEEAVPGEAAHDAFRGIQSHFRFAALAEPQMKAVISMMRRADVDSGVEVTVAGQLADLVYVIESGSVEAIDPVTGETEAQGPGSLFGDGSLGYLKPRQHTVRTTAACVLWVLRASDFRTAVARVDQELVQSRYEWLTNVPLLRALTPGQLVAAARAMESVTYGDGDKIIRMGDMGDAFYIVQEGNVVCRVQVSATGTWTTVASLKSGDFFGEMALLNDTPRSADVIAVGAVTCLKLDRKPFEEVLGPLQQLLDEEASRRRKHLDAKRGQVNTMDKGRSTKVMDAEALAVQAKLINSESGGVKKQFSLAEADPVGLLGEGSFGVVQLVKWRGRPCAMKRLWKLQLVQARQTVHVNRERRLLSAIDHPFVVKLRGTCQDEASLYMLLDFVGGGELWSLIYNDDSPLIDAPPVAEAAGAGADGEGGNAVEEFRGMRESAARFYAANVVEALRFLHEAGVAYRDLKPENVLIAPDGYIRMVDFGFSKSIPFEKDGKVVPQSHTFLGSPEYLPPEVILHKGHDKAVDLWGLGVLIFELLMGTSPFAHENQNRVFAMACEGAIQHADDLEALSPDAADLVRKLLQPDPARRIGALRGGMADVMEHPWFAGIDWDLLVAKKHPGGPPYKPEMASPEDRSHFELAGDDEAEAAAAVTPEAYLGDDGGAFDEF